MSHISVLLHETVDAVLADRNTGIYVDATLGHGGHTIEILKRGGIVYGFDQDPSNLEVATTRIKELGLDANFHPIHANFNQLTDVFR